jgi:hypothetical protein
VTSEPRIGGAQRRHASLCDKAAENRRIVFRPDAAAALAYRV